MKTVILLSLMFFFFFSNSLLGVFGLKLTMVLRNMYSLLFLLSLYEFLFSCLELLKIIHKSAQENEYR